MGQMGYVGVPKNQALIIFANCFQVKSSYKLSRRIPSWLQWRCCVKSANNGVGCSFRHFISSHFVLWNGGSEIDIGRF